MNKLTFFSSVLIICDFKDGNNRVVFAIKVSKIIPGKLQEGVSCLLSTYDVSKFPLPISTKSLKCKLSH